MRRRALAILVLASCACSASAPTPARSTAGSADDFCADFGQHCGPSASVGCCAPLVCTPRTEDDGGDVLVHQCLAP